MAETDLLLASMNPGKLQEMKDLVEFLKTLTGAFPPVETGRLPK